MNPMSKLQLHQNFCQKNKKLCDWYYSQTSKLHYPIYSSYDIRDAGFKISNVDANIFPAGFNNICPTDKEHAPEIFSEFIDKHYGTDCKRIMLVTEEHTNNPFYWENVLTIKNLLQEGGRSVLIAIAQALPAPIKVQSATGVEIEVVSAFEKSQAVQDFKPQLIVSNNDFSDAHEEWAKQVSLPVNPPRELGWYQRKKSRYFEKYNQLVKEFAELGEFDPFLLSVETKIYDQFDLDTIDSVNDLAEAADKMIADLKVLYKQKGIDRDPVIFVKNNAGTYGLGVVRVQSGEEVKSWNSKSRKKMKAAKGGNNVNEVILQEGIPSRVQAEGSTAEPVIYMIGTELAGGFLRSHSEKSDTESLNSPGAVYKRLCVADLNVSLEKAPLENVYGWSARLGLLAIALEAQEMKVEFKNFRP